MMVSSFFTAIILKRPQYTETALKLSLFCCLDVAKVDMSEYDPAVIASTLKKFLRELPDPVIPVQWYDRFIEVSSKYLSCYHRPQVL